MCFSAGASITAGVLLTVAGAATLQKVHKPSQMVFASIPLFFAFQQFTEGALWLVIPHTGYSGVKTVATYLFLLMAQVVWPVMVPISVMLMEDDKKRKKILIVLLGAGAAVALYYLYSLVAFYPHAQISRMHIAYKSTFKDPFLYAAMVLYLTATLAPLFVSSIKRTYILGTIVGLSFVISTVFYFECLTSVWCFFAAIMSFVVYYIVRDAHKQFHLGDKILELASKLPILKK